MPASKEESTISSGTLRNARQLDDEAWDRIVQVYHDRVYRQVLRSGIGEQAATDLVCHVFRKACLKLHRFSRDTPDQRLGRWLNTLTRNLIVDFIRRRQHAPQQLGSNATVIVSSADESDAEEQTVDALIKQTALAAAIDEVSLDYQALCKSDHWQCFWLRFGEGMTVAVIAEQLGMTETNVRTVCSRIKCRVAAVARGKLREISNGKLDF